MMSGATATTRDGPVRCSNFDHRSGRAVDGVAERDSAPGIGGLLCLDGDLGDAAGLVQRKRGRRFAA